MRDDTIDRLLEVVKRNVVKELGVTEQEALHLLRVAIDRADPTLGPGLCEAPDCVQTAEYEGWNRSLDPAIGTPTGLVRRVRVCKRHRSLTIGGRGE